MTVPPFTRPDGATKDWPVTQCAVCLAFVYEFVLAPENGEGLCPPCIEWARDPGILLTKEEHGAVLTMVGTLTKEPGGEWRRERPDEMVMPTLSWEKEGYVPSWAEGDGDG